MRKLVVFDQVSLDGYFSGPNGDISWAHKQDPEWDAFVAENASNGGVLVFGRITYDLMMQYWPTPEAIKNSPAVAEAMNDLPKVVFSRTLDKASWNNTRLVKSDIAGTMRKMKEGTGENLVILGSGSIVSQLTQEGLIDEYQIVVNPVVLGDGRTLFENVERKVPLKRTRSRTFGNGNVLLYYEPVERAAS